MKTGLTTQPGSCFSTSVYASPEVYVFCSTGVDFSFMAEAAMTPRQHASIPLLPFPLLFFLGSSPFGDSAFIGISGNRLFFVHS